MDSHVDMRFPIPYLGVLLKKKSRNARRRQKDAFHNITLCLHVFDKRKKKASMSHFLPKVENYALGDYLDAIIHPENNFHRVETYSQQIKKKGKGSSKLTHSFSARIKSVEEIISEISTHQMQGKLGRWSAQSHDRTVAESRLVRRGCSEEGTLFHKSP